MHEPKIVMMQRCILFFERTNSIPTGTGRYFAYNDCRIEKILFEADHRMRGQLKM